MLVTPKNVQNFGTEIATILRRHLDAHRTANVDWPADAVYGVQYSLKCWPCDWTDHVRFFKSQEELAGWYARQLEWARLEDNHFELDHLYFWDLGPNRIDQSDWALHLQTLAH